jgi:hypothetical protein
LQRTVSIASAAVILVAALAWNSAFQSTFERVSWLHRFGPWVYAIVVTILAVLLVQLMHYATDVPGRRPHGGP